MSDVKAIKVKRSGNGEKETRILINDISNYREWVPDDLKYGTKQTVIYLKGGQSIVCDHDIKDIDDAINGVLEVK